MKIAINSLPVRYGNFKNNSVANKACNNNNALNTTNMSSVQKALVSFGNLSGIYKLEAVNTLSRKQNFLGNTLNHEYNVENDVFYDAAKSEDVSEINKLVEKYKGREDLLRNGFMRINPHQESNPIRDAAENSNPEVLKAICALFKDHEKELRDAIAYSDPDSDEFGEDDTNCAAFWVAVDMDTPDNLKTLCDAFKGYEEDLMKYLTNDIVFQTVLDNKNPEILKTIIDVFHGNEDSLRKISTQKGKNYNDFFVSSGDE